MTPRHKNDATSVTVRRSNAKMGGTPKVARTSMISIASRKLSPDPAGAVFPSQTRLIAL